MVTIISVIIIIYYDRVKEKSFYSIYSSAVENKVDLPASSVPDLNSKNVFVVEGFSLWNKALERFKCHESKYLITLFSYSRVELRFLSIFVIFVVSYFVRLNFSVSQKYFKYTIVVDNRRYYF
jgi:hypothetical protein